MSLLSLACLLTIVGQVYMAAIPENQVELYLVVEQEVLKKYIQECEGDKAQAEAKLTKDTDYFVSEMNKIFMNGMNIGLLKKDLVVLEEDFLVGSEVERFGALEKFDEWRKGKAPLETLKYDVAVLWTGRELVKEDGNPSTAGFAHVGKVCNPFMSSMIGEYDMTYNTVMVTAHELGHCLGSNHDSDNDRKVMGKVAFAGSKNRWTFSQESIDSIKSTIAGLESNCLQVTDPNSKSVEAVLPSKDLADPDHLCMRTMQSKTAYMLKANTFYEMMPAIGDKVCSVIFCYNGTENGYPAYASDGMICDKNKRCKQGICADAPDAESGAVPSGECALGDQTNVDVPGFSGICSDLIKTYGKFVCYYYKSMCCDTCSAVADLDQPDCMFGDKSKKCEGKNPDSVCPGSKSTCCGLCKDYQAKRSVEGETEVIEEDKNPLPVNYGTSIAIETV